MSTVLQSSKPLITTGVVPREADRLAALARYQILDTGAGAGVRSRMNATVKIDAARVELLLS